MNEEDEQKQNETAGSGGHGTPSQDAAARAVAQAREGMSKGVAEFKRLDRKGQIYLAGLAVVVVFGLLFNALRFPDFEAYRKIVGFTAGRSTLAGAGNPGMLMMLAALGGIGIYVWNLRTAAKQSWVPMALAGCAGMALLMILLATRTGSGLVEIKVSRTLLGFWLPLAGAAAATWASVKPILDARPKASPPRPAAPPPPPPPVD